MPRSLFCHGFNSNYGSLSDFAVLAEILVTFCFIDEDDLDKRADVPSIGNGPELGKFESAKHTLMLVGDIMFARLLIDFILSSFDLFRQVLYRAHLFGILSHLLLQLLSPFHNSSDGLPSLLTMTRFFARFIALYTAIVYWKW